MTNNIKQAIIIGGGPAGVSAALYLARAGQKVCIIENGPGALAKAHKIDNYYGIAASGAKLYAAGLEQARSLGVEILQDEVRTSPSGASINPSLSVFCVSDESAPAPLSLF